MCEWIYKFIFIEIGKIQLRIYLELGWGLPKEDDRTLMTVWFWRFPEVTNRLQHKVFSSHGKNDGAWLENTKI